jgi:hypothetical protein
MPGAPEGPLSPAAGHGPHRILETGYKPLTELGKEEAGYGLYSYALMPTNSDRSSSFLAEIFKAIPSVEATAAAPAEVNILYIPLRKGTEPAFGRALEQASRSSNIDTLASRYAKDLYDYKLARAILDHLCNPPAASMRSFCAGDISRGPYLFAYAAPASKFEPVPPPFLFVDLSDVHERAFAEFVGAFREQVKREDVSDRARINTLRLSILNLALLAADWITPVEKKVVEIVHSAVDEDPGKGGGGK